MQPILLPSRYQASVRAEIAAHPPVSTAIISDANLARLPDPVQRYFRRCGFVGHPHTWNARIHWSSLSLKRTREATWMPVRCRQFNAVAEPTRIVLMQGRLLGLPFEGRDAYLDGHGQMLIKLAKLVPVANMQGREMDASALVTFLAEALLVPSAALQPYIRWQPVGRYAARATIIHGGTAVGGQFYFDEDGALIRFETEDRWQDSRRRVPWSAAFGGYHVQAGLRLPTAVSACWHEPAGDFTYACGTIATIDFNVTD